MVVMTHELQDGKLPSNSGRVVIYKNFIDFSYGQSRDHNDLLRSLAAKYHLPKDEVISNAIRLYYMYKNENIVVCPVRKIDENDYDRRQQFYDNLIQQTMGMKQRRRESISSLVEDLVASRPERLKRMIEAVNPIDNVNLVNDFNNKRKPSVYNPSSGLSFSKALADANKAEEEKAVEAKKEEMINLLHMFLAMLNSGLTTSRSITYKKNDKEYQFSLKKENDKIKMVINGVDSGIVVNQDNIRNEVNKLFL